MRYAVNLSDWYAHQTDVGLRLILKPVINPDPDALLDCEPGQDAGLGLEIACDEERAEAIVQMIRRVYKPHEFRCYKASGEAWKRI